MRKILDLLIVVFVDVLQQIKVNINIISRRYLDTLRNIDKFCRSEHTYASNLNLFSCFYRRFNLSHCTVLASYRSLMPIEADVLASV